MDLPTPTEIDAAIERLKNAARLYRTLYDSEMPDREDFLRRTMSALLDACKRMGKPSPLHAGLLNEDKIVLDLLRLYEAYSNSASGFLRSDLVKIIGQRLSTERISALCLSPEDIAARNSNKKGGPFDLAYRVTGELWGCSEKTIRDKLRKAGYPNNLKEFKTAFQNSRAKS